MLRPRWECVVGDQLAQSKVAAEAARGPNVHVLLAGKEMQGCEQVIEEEKAVAQSLFAYYQKVPRYAKYVQIGLDDSRCTIFADCERAAQKMVVARIGMN